MKTFDEIIEEMKIIEYSNDVDIIVNEETFKQILYDFSLIEGIYKHIDKSDKRIYIRIENHYEAIEIKKDFSSIYLTYAYFEDWANYDCGVHVYVDLKYFNDVPYEEYITSQMKTYIDKHEKFINTFCGLLPTKKKSARH